MRCLYCGEPLSLLRKLTGKAEFCSEAHRVAYQEEFNSLALQRLASQPTQSRRAAMSFALPPDPVADPVASHQAAEPFAGFPFPEDVEDLDPPSQLTAFDQPLAVRASLAAEPPAPLGGLLANAPFYATGETPPTYSLPTLLEDYPRRYLMTNGVFPVTEAGVVPFIGYLDLPEPMEVDDSDPCLELRPEPRDPLIGWKRPPWQILRAGSNSLPAATMLVPFPAFLTGTVLAGTVLADTENALAPFTCALVLPDPEPQTFPQFVQRSSRMVEPFVPWARLFPLDEGFVPAGTHVGKFQSAGQGVDYEAWHSSRLLTAARPDALTLPALEFAALAAEIDLDVHWQTSRESDVASVAIPECECFDAERSLVAPHLDAGWNPSVGQAGPFELEAASSPLSHFGLLSSPDPSRLVGHPDPRPWDDSGCNGSADPTIPEAGFVVAGLLVERGAEPGPACAANEPALANAQGPLPWVASRVSAVETTESIHERALPVAGEVGWFDFALCGLSKERARPSDITWRAFSLPSLFTLRMAAGGDAHHALPPFDGLSILAFDLSVIPPAAETPPELPTVPVFEPEIAAECGPTPWKSEKLATTRRSAQSPASMLAKFRVKDFSWPGFAAGCESLFTPDQPFRFHELPFPSRGTTDQVVGDVLQCDIMQALLLPYVDDRFEAIFHPGLEAEVLGDWLDETTNRAGNWPSAKPKKPAADDPLGSVGAETKTVPPAAKPPAPRVAEPPSSWQQAARAMHEGEQQVPSAPSGAFHGGAPPDQASAINDEGRPVTAVPVANEPMSGFELTRMPPSEPPIRFPPGASPQNRDGNRDANHDGNRSPANDQPQFEWRREQPQPASGHSSPGQAGSNITVNTTINVDGNADGVVVESAIRISLGNKKKKKEDALEKFAEGEDLDESRLRIAPVENLPGFAADPPELRAMLQPIASLADSIQWPKFSVTPMRRRIAFGPAKMTFFGGGAGQSAPKPAPPAAHPLPPKKGVGFLFKKLTNS